MYNSNAGSYIYGTTTLHLYTQCTKIKICVSSAKVTSVKTLFFRTSKRGHYTFRNTHIRDRAVKNDSRKFFFRRLSGYIYDTVARVHPYPDAKSKKEYNSDDE